MAWNSSRIRCSNSTGLSASRSGRLSSPAMTFISFTNLYFDRSNCRTGRTASRSYGCGEITALRKPVKHAFGSSSGSSSTISPKASLVACTLISSGRTALPVVRSFDEK